MVGRPVLKPPLIAIGLDAAEPSWIEAQMARGTLPNLAALSRQGAYGRLKNPGWYPAEQAWTTFLTGCSPRRTGHWTNLRFDPETYAVWVSGTYDFHEYPPFYALGPNYRVAAFDLPHATLSPGVEGIQVVAWGAHSAHARSGSQPPELIDDLIRKHGSHPALERDHASHWNPIAMRWLEHALGTGIGRRSAICRDLLRREQWDLFLTAFGEPHSGGHFFWHRTDPRHPLHEADRRRDPMVKIFRAIDRAIGEILEAAPRGASVIVFSPEGMKANNMDLPSIVFLPELLFRFQHPGVVGLAGSSAPRRRLPAAVRRPKALAWHRDLYARRADARPLRRWLRPLLPIEITHAWERFRDPGPGPGYPMRFGSLFYQPPMWYSPLWPSMKCFGLPSFSEGYVRVNLKGREARGIVPPEEYSALCEEILELVMELRDARSGESLVREVVRTRSDPLDGDPRLPDADLIVRWNDVVTDLAEHPERGRIGPVPFGRPGGHSDRGFAIIRGAGITPGSSFPEAPIKDLAPTMLALLGAPIPDRLEGSSLTGSLCPSPKA